MATKFKLLNVDANPKTVKGQDKGYMTAVLYMTPERGADPDTNLCPSAQIAGCVTDCLNTAGRGGMAPGNGTFVSPSGTVLPDNTVQRARLRRTMMFLHDRTAFMRLLVSEINAAYRMAVQAGLTLVVRPNGTTDIRWEDIYFTLTDSAHAKPYNIFEVFPNIQFYDYTKLPNRRRALDILNYNLTFSYSHRAEFAPIIVKALQVYGDKVNFAAVFARKKSDPMPEYFLGREVIDGDESDLRFLDRAGVVVALTAKGRARKSDSGFIVR